MAEHPLHAKRLQGDIFARFKALAARLFLPTPPPPATDVHLSGRIQTLQDDAREMLEALTALKNELEFEADPDLTSSIEAVVNPIIRDVHRLQKYHAPESVEERLVAVENYTQWIDRAKPWADFFSHHFKDRAAVIQAVINYTIRSASEMISRDMQIISDYQEHKLLEVADTDSEREQFKQAIEVELTDLITKLTTLQNDIPKQLEALSLKQLEDWKKRIAGQREEYYNLSLQAIDKAISSIAPVALPSSALAATQELHDHVVKNLTRIVILEETIVPLLQEIEHNQPLDQDLRQELAARLAPLENDVNLLHQELDLTPELAERLLLVQVMLDEAKTMIA